MTILDANTATDKFKPGPLQNNTSHQTNSTDYFTKSAGQYATMDGFAFTQNHLSQV